jgi:hypothetical protein
MQSSYQVFLFASVIRAHSAGEDSAAARRCVQTSMAGSHPTHSSGHSTGRS